MRRKTGAIFLETLPETIITSAWRGLARNTSEPKRARSLRDDVAFIISIAQQASPKVAGQSDDLRAQLISESSRVVSTSGKASAITFSSPILKTTSGCGPSFLEPPPVFQIVKRACFGFGFTSRLLAPIKRALLNYVDITSQQQPNKNHHFQIHKPAHRVALSGKRFEHNGPRHQEDHLYIKEDEKHRDHVKLHGEALTTRSDRILAALVRHQLRLRSLALTDKLRQQDVDHGEARRDDEHQKDRQIVVKPKRHLQTHSRLPEIGFARKPVVRGHRHSITRLRIIVQA